MKMGDKSYTKRRFSIKSFKELETNHLIKRGLQNRFKSHHQTYGIFSTTSRPF